jgi:signal transduction histidine kinase
MKIILPFLLLLFTGNSLSAQTDLANFNVRHYTTENGLPQDMVRGIAKDEYGFIWLATQLGLVRFDGEHFRVYDKNATGTTSSRIHNIKRSLDEQKLLAVNEAEELLQVSKGSVRKYVPGRGDMIWAKERAEQIDRYWFAETYREFIGLRSFNSHLSVAISMEGLTWYSDTAAPAFIPFKYPAKISGYMLADAKLYIYSDDVSGIRIWCVTQRGASQVKFTGDFANNRRGAGHEEWFLQTNGAAKQIFLFAGENLYLVTSLPNGDLDTRLLLSGFNLGKNEITRAFYDTQYKRLLLGSEISGLFVFDKKDFLPRNAAGSGSMPVNIIYDHIAYTDSSVLTPAGLSLSTNPTIPTKLRPLLHAGPGNYHIFRLANKEVWMCSGLKVHRFDASARTVLKEWNCSDAVSLIQGKDNRLWIGSSVGDLSYLDPGKANSEPQHFLKLKGGIMGMEWEGADTLWVCADGGLRRIRISDRKVDLLPALAGKVARGLYIPRKGEVWICTYEDGLYLFRDNKLTHFPTENNPYLNNVHKILEDDQGFFWMSTNRGLYQAKRTDLIRYAEKGGEAPYFFYYSKESGFLTNEFNGRAQNVGNKLGNGYFSFASMNGVVFFKPDELQPELPNAPVIIDKVEINGAEVDMGRTSITVPRDFKRLTIIPGTAYLGNAWNLRFEFSVDDTLNWQEMRDGKIDFSAFEPGYHTIFIRKIAGFGGNNYTVANVKLHYPHAWWQTTWFYAGAPALLIALVWLIVRMRVRYWKRRNKVLEDAVQDRTEDLKTTIQDLERSENHLGEQLKFQRVINGNIVHDINTPLRFLTVLTGDIMTRAARNEMPSLETVSYIHDTAGQVHQSVQNLNIYIQARMAEHNITTEKFSLFEMLEQKMALFSIAANRQRILFINDVPQTLLLQQNESLFSILLHNLIDNAIKNVENGTISFAAIAEDDQPVTLTITDTGRGMNAAQLDRLKNHMQQQKPVTDTSGIGFGFVIIREIALMMKLSINIESTIGQGTKFRIRIPVFEMKK